MVPRSQARRYWGLRCALLLFLVERVSAKTVVSVSSKDLVTQGLPSVDNVKVSYETVVNVGSHKTRCSTVYDLKQRTNFVTEASATGSFDSLRYAISHHFAKSITVLSLATSQGGMLFQAKADTSVLQDPAHTHISISRDFLSQLSASKSIGVVEGRGALVIEPAYLVKRGLARLRLSASVELGSGVAVASQLTADHRGQYDADYSLEYATLLRSGRKLSASLSPSDMHADIQLVDAKLEPSANWVATASVGLHDKPMLTVRRVQQF